MFQPNVYSSSVNVYPEFRESRSFYVDIYIVFFFNGMFTYLGLFCVGRLGNHFQFFVILYLQFFGMMHKSWHFDP